MMAAAASGMRRCAAPYADKILGAVKARQMLDSAFQISTQSGTLNFNARDKHGNMGALPLTHGDGFGAHVTLDGLGLALGHGMSRFDLRPDHHSLFLSRYVGQIHAFDPICPPASDSAR